MAPGYSVDLSWEACPNRRKRELTESMQRSGGQVELVQDSRMQISNPRACKSASGAGVKRRRVGLGGRGREGRAATGQSEARHELLRLISNPMNGNGEAVSTLGAISARRVCANAAIIPLRASANYDNQVFTASLANFSNLLPRPPLCVTCVFLTATSLPTSFVIARKRPFQI